MENFTEEFLRTICKPEVTGNFPPFDSGKIKEVEKYIKQILVKINSENEVLIKSDFDNYGSGFASYVDVRISKKDKSDTKITKDGNKRTEWTKGLSLYISKLCPFWFIGGSQWTVTYENEKLIGGSSGFLRPESVDSIDEDFWKNETKNIQKVFVEFGYNLLKKEQTGKELCFDIDIPTILADKPYQIFDCFFYWED